MNNILVISYFISKVSVKLFRELNKSRRLWARIVCKRRGNWSKIISSYFIPICV